MNFHKQFDKIFADQVFEKRPGITPRLTRLEKIFILRCIIEKWDMGHVAATIKRSRNTVFRFRRQIWTDPRRLFDITGLYQIVGKEKRKQQIPCTLCRQVLVTTEKQMKMHVAKHVVPWDMLGVTRF